MYIKKVSLVILILFLIIPFSGTAKKLSYYYPSQKWNASMYKKFNYRSFARYRYARQKIGTNIDLELLAAAIFYESNRARARQGIGPYKFCIYLKRGAQYHAIKQVRRILRGKRWHHAHTKNVLLKMGLKGGHWAAENMAGWFNPKKHTYLKVAKSLVRMWMRSRGHRRNLLNGRKVVDNYLGCAFYYSRGKAVAVQQMIHRHSPLLQCEGGGGGDDNKKKYKNKIWVGVTGAKKVRLRFRPYGRKFMDMGRGQYILTGLRVYAGVIIDAVQPIYRKLLTNGGILGREKYGRKYGGRGGYKRNVKLKGYVVTKIRFVRAKWHGLTCIGKIKITLQKWTAKGPKGRKISKTLGGWSRGRWVTYKAGYKKVFTGIHGRYSKAVTDLGPIVSRLIIKRRRFKPRDPYIRDDDNRRIRRRDKSCYPFLKRNRKLYWKTYHRSGKLYYRGHLIFTGLRRTGFGGYQINYGRRYKKVRFNGYFWGKKFTMRIGRERWKGICSRNGIRGKVRSFTFKIYKKR